MRKPVRVNSTAFYLFSYTWSNLHTLYLAVLCSLLRLRCYVIPLASSSFHRLSPPGATKRKTNSRPSSTAVAHSRHNDHDHFVKLIESNRKYEVTLHFFRGKRRVPTKEHSSSVLFANFSTHPPTRSQRSPFTKTAIYVYATAP